MTREKNIKEELYSPEDEKLIDYKLSEFRKKNKIGDIYFKNNIESYIKHFNLNIEEIKNGDEDTNYNIPFLAEPIMGVMFRNFKLNPLVDGRRNKNNIPIDKLIEYNQKLFEDIEQLPIDMKYNLKRTSTYEFNYMLNEVIPVILDKMSILFSLLIFNSSVSAGNPYIDLIDSLDSWIVNFINYSIDLEEKNETINDESYIRINIDNYGGLNFEKDSTYIMDKILKDEYITNINKVILLKDKLKKVGTQNLFDYIDCKANKKIIDKSKIDREKIIKWINDIENEDTYYYKNLLHNREIDLQFYKDDLSISKLDYYNKLDYYQEQFTIDYRNKIHMALLDLEESYKEYKDKIDFIDKILKGNEYDMFYKCLYAKLKKIINSKEYSLAIKEEIDDIDFIESEFNKLLDKLAKEMWIELNGDSYKKDKRIKEIIEMKYEELNEKESQINLVRSYLAKAIGQTITPTLQDEIKRLSKNTDEK
ncbi:hypothetical protein QYP21_03045 [Clostridioides difficile]|nr:hypothetical protein [Clostridioides difficile]